MIRHIRAFYPSTSPNRPHSDKAPAGVFWRKLGGRAAPPGEERLALAILEDALRCLNGRHDSWEYPPRLFRWEAERWFESRDRVPLFSFENICSILALDATCLRRQIRRVVIETGH